MEKSKWGVLVLSLFVLVPSVSAVAEAQPSFGTISGDVRDIENRPITNVTVYLTNETIKTFEDAQAAGLALVGPDVSKLFLQSMEDGEEAWMQPREQPATPPQPIVVVPEIGEIEAPQMVEAHYVLKNVPPGTYTVNARAIRDDGKVIAGRALNVVVHPNATTMADIVLEVARPASIVVSAYPKELPVYREGATPATAEVTARLLDSFGLPVGAGYDVSFGASAGTITTEPVTTDATGKVTAEYTADVSKTGVVNIAVIYIDPETSVVINGTTTIRLFEPGTYVRAPVQPGQDSGKEKYLGGVKGKVVDLKNKPIKGAEIRLGEIVASTDEKGEFEIHGLVPNDYVLVATAEGKESKQIIEVKENETAYVVITIPIELQTYAHKATITLPFRKEIYLDRGAVLEVKAQTTDGTPITVDLINAIGKRVYRKTSDAGAISGTYAVQSSDPYTMEFWSPEKEGAIELEYTITLYREQRKEDISLE